MQCNTEVGLFTKLSYFVEKSVIGLIGHVDVGLACYLKRSVHGKDGCAAVPDLHAVDGAAAQS